MYKSKLTMILLATAFLVSCANVPVVKLGNNSSVSLNGKTLVVVTHKPGPFVAVTAGKGAFGLLGAAAMYSAGRAQVIKFGIIDPAIKIRSTLVDGLKTKYNLNVKQNNSAPLENRSFSSILRTYKDKADLILDYRTFEMGYYYYPTKWGRYRVRYIGKLQLINSKSKKVIASSSCISIHGDKNNPPKKNQLLANNASMIKAFLAKATTRCSQILKTEILGLQ